MKFIDLELKYSDSKRIREALIEQAAIDPIFKEKLDKWEVSEENMVKLLAAEAYKQTLTDVGRARVALSFGIEEQIAHIIHCVDEGITEVKKEDEPKATTKVADSKGKKTVSAKDEKETEELEDDNDEEVVAIDKRPAVTPKPVKDKKGKQLPEGFEQGTLF